MIYKSSVCICKGLEFQIRLTAAMVTPKVIMKSVEGFSGRARIKPWLMNGV